MATKRQEHSSPNRDRFWLPSRRSVDVGRISEAFLPTSQDSHEQVAEDGRRTRRHIDMVAERLESQLRLLAEDQISLRDRMGYRFDELVLALRQVDHRLMSLEARPPRR